MYEINYEPIRQLDAKYGDTIRGIQECELKITHYNWLFYYTEQPYEKYEEYWIQLKKWESKKEHLLIDLKMNTIININ